MGKVSNLRAARFKLADSHPYLATAVWALQLIERDMSDLQIKDGDGNKVADRPIAVDDKWRLYYDPTFVEGIKTSHLSTILLHEVNHLIRDHAGRRKTKSADPLLWNLAGDAEINDDLLAEKLPGLDQAFFPKYIPADDGQLAEVYYDLLMQDQEQNQTQRSAEGVGNGACGSCAHGQPEEHEEPEGGQGKGEGKGDGDQDSDSGGGDGDGDVDNDTPTGVSEAEAKFLRRQIAKDVQQYEKSHGIGKVPEHYKRWADLELEPPKVSWQELLQGRIRRAFERVRGQVDYSYMRPSRRASVFPRIIMPSMHKPVPDVCVVIDTSGSMGTAEGRAALSETSGVLQGSGASDIRVMSCDAEVHTDKRVRSLSEIELGGGGGTDMGRALEVLAEDRVKAPNIAIVMTDGYTPWPEHQPPFEVIVAVINGSTHNIPPWARYVEIGNCTDEEW